MQKPKIIYWLSRNHLLVKGQSVLEDDMQCATVMDEEQIEMFFQMNDLVCPLLTCEMECGWTADKNYRTV